MKNGQGIVVGGNELVSFTPLSGGRNSENNLCGVLEIGNSKIVIDCGGSSVDSNINILHAISDKLKQIGSIDAVLVSHADVQHMGALPILFGKEGHVVPVICTLPVYKMGQMLLYDLSLNKYPEEGIDAPQFTLDNIDACFSKVITVKYRQTISIPSNPDISVCAYPSGRTLGGSGWLIRYRATEVLYFLDINLKKEVVLDGASLEQLPKNPTLLMLEGSCADAKATRRRKGRDDGLLAAIMETVRNNGNVLLPCESTGRTFEILQLLHKHWVDQSLALYHLVFLSPMASNILEFAQSQLEWMNDSLSSGFYNGRPNPYTLLSLKRVATVRELDSLPPGPRVVLATDSSLMYGPAKELLLRWGGDPKNCVIFTDSSEPGSLADELRNQEPPVIATVSRIDKVELEGKELEVFQEAQRAVRREEEAEQHRRRMADELAQLAADQEEELEEEDLENTVSSTSTTIKPSLKRQRSSLSSDGLETMRSKFATPRFPMFETRDPGLVTTDGYGMSIQDLTMLTKPAPTQAPGRYIDSKASSASANVARSKASGKSGLGHSTDANSSVAAEVRPFKLVTRRGRVQFTCTFKQFCLGNRADTKAIRTVLGAVSAKKVLVLGGRGHESDAVVALVNKLGGDGCAPTNLETVSLAVRGERVRLELPTSLIQQYGKELLGDIGLGRSVTCSIAPLAGKVGETVTSGRGGLRVARWLGGLDQDVGGGLKRNERGDVVEGGGEEMEVVDEEYDAPLSTDRLGLPLSIGAVSVGEVLLENLRQLVERMGVSTEYRLSASGGLLVCGGQVVLRKEEENDFVLEGPPTAAFYKTRQALYQQFAFV